MKVTTIGFDIAKGVIQVHGVDAAGGVTLRKRLSRAGALKFFASLEPCLIGVEACGGAHYWARELASFGCGSVDFASLREALRQAFEDRRRRRRRDLRGGEPAAHALRGDQEPRRAGLGAGLQNARASGGAAHGAGQRVARASDRVRRCGAAWTGGRGAAGCAGAGEGTRHCRNLLTRRWPNWPT